MEKVIIGVLVAGFLTVLVLRRDDIKSMSFFGFEVRF